MSPRRLTGQEEAEIRQATARAETARKRADELFAERDRLVADIKDAGARVTDVASVLGVTKKTAYDMIRRARESG